MNKQIGPVVGAVIWSAAMLMPAAAAEPAQDPVIGTLAMLTPSQDRHPPIVRNSRPGEVARWQEVLLARRPSRIVSLCQAFLRDFPESIHRDQAKTLEAGASRVVTIKRDVGLSADYFEATRGDAAFDASLLGAARGDPEAAYRLAQIFGDGKSGKSPSMYRHEQWLRLAAELNHARASWELAQLYNVYGRVAEAAHFEKRATSLGYKPPPRLSNRDY